MGRVAYFVLGVMACFGYGCGLDSYDIIHEHYPSGSEALVSQSVLHGWLPKDIPQTATDVYDWHSVDTNKVWARWSLSRSDYGIWLKSYQAIEVRDVTLPRSPNRVLMRSKAKWWTFEEARQRDNLTFLRRSGEPDAFWAADESSGTIYFWRP